MSKYESQSQSVNIWIIDEQKELASAFVASHSFDRATLKAPVSDLTRKGSIDARPIFGSDPTRKPGQTDPESESERHFWLRFRVSLTQIPDQSWPRKCVWPNGTLSGSNLTPGVLECSSCFRAWYILSGDATCALTKGYLKWDLSQTLVRESIVIQV